MTGPALRRAVDIEDRLRAGLGAVPGIFNNGHPYFEALGWIAANVLRFRVQAYDREPGKEYVATFRYDVAGRVSRAPRLPRAKSIAAPPEERMDAVSR